MLKDFYSVPDRFTTWRSKGLKLKLLSIVIPKSSSAPLYLLT